MSHKTASRLAKSAVCRRCGVQSMSVRRTSGLCRGCRRRATQHPKEPTR